MAAKCHNIIGIIVINEPYVHERKHTKKVETLSRLDINTPDQAQMVVDQLYHDMERRIIASGPGLCPIDMC